MNPERSITFSLCQKGMQTPWTAQNPEKQKVHFSVFENITVVGPKDKINTERGKFGSEFS